MDYPVLRYFEDLLAGLKPVNSLNFEFPPAIAVTLGFSMTEIGLGTCTMAMATEPRRHGNPMRTIHGGVLCDIADAAIGTAHSTYQQSGESFTSVDLQIKFFRPVWEEQIRAVARVVNHGKTLSYYTCEILRADGKVAAAVNSTVMTLRGDASKGR